MERTNYEEFLASKHVRAKSVGIDVEDSRINPALFPFQRYVVKRTLKTGKGGIFADCGLGKTFMQYEVMRIAAKETGKPALIVTPLAVASQMIADVARVEHERLSFAASDADLVPGKVHVTNYEKIKHFTLADLGGLSLDESSIIANYTGTYKRYIIEQSKGVLFKVSNSATPSPNNHMEIGNHAEFLEVMPSNEMLARWFIADSMHAGNYRLKHYARDDFWKWVSSWAICITSPADLGFDATGYNLPPLNIEHHIVDVDMTKGRGDELIRNVELSATSIHKEMRLTAPNRAAAVAEMVNNSTERWAVWCNTDYEADELKKLIPDAVEVRGSMPEKKKLAALNDFTEGRVRVIITKPPIAGFGLNWQHVFNTAFVGLSYSFQHLYQALRRLYRFGQERPVNAHIFMAETEIAVLGAVEEKIARFEEMQKEMSATVSAHTIERDDALIDVRGGDVAEGERWEMRHGDSCLLIKDVPENHIDFSVFSPPFANLYIYSGSLQDMGNSADCDEFIEHYKYLAGELLRITKPGRLAAVHCKDLPLYKNRDGAMGLYDFPGELRIAMESVGWVFHSRVTIWKDPVIEMQRTKNHGLLYKELCKDSAGSRTGMSEQVLVFRKWQGEFENPVKGECEDGQRFHRYIGSEEPVNMKRGGVGAFAGAPRGFVENPYEPGTNDHYRWSIEVWQRYASPVWFDIDQTRVLQESRDTKQGDEERHICPLQLDVVERAVHLWTNPGDLVFSPFAGIGSEGYGTLSLHGDRRFLGFELKKEYFEVAKRNLAKLEQELGQDMFRDVAI